MGKYSLDLKKYARLSQEMIAEGCVLLRNQNGALPLREGEKIALFGRGNFNYYKSGLGSGGMVNTRYVVSVLDALKDCTQIHVNRELLGIYEDWIYEHPYDGGHGWGTVPWSQEEMPVTSRMCKIAAESDAAVITIARTAGEDQDNSNKPGSYFLTRVERDLIAKVSKAAKRTIVLLNVGNIIDMNWMDEYEVDAVMYIWQGGQEGGTGVRKLLLGETSPSGRLTDTIAYSIKDYPSDGHFGSKKRNIYAEDIYVGYRYFETFARDKVMFPFGFGLSYTEFDVIGSLEHVSEEQISVTLSVTNTGAVAGKNTVLIFVEAPQGKLGQPTRKLIDFYKTKELSPGETVSAIRTIPKYRFASFDDAGLVARNSYVLEEGIYGILVGGDVRSAVPSGDFKQKKKVFETLSEALAPRTAFVRIHPRKMDEGYEMIYEAAPRAEVDLEERIASELPAELDYTGDCGHRLIDVYDGKITLDTFTAQISDDDLMAMFHGEGMCSPKVTPGTAAGFGGVTESLQKLGIPMVACADGPSGIRMDCGTKAFSLPNGAVIGSSFNVELTEELFEMTGQELRLNKIASLLGPGMNIHRHPLNGRNFEYISEDPLLTGMICAAQIRGMDKFGIGSTIKHFAGNNQESGRSLSDSVISQRALREIYLKGFEIAVKEGGARSVMTTYGSLNGLWTSGSYDLCTTILRNEWGFDGIVMTDWWAVANYAGKASDEKHRAPMVRAQNDLYMVTGDAVKAISEDDVAQKLQEGFITRGMLQRNAKNVLGFLLRTPALLLQENRLDPEEVEEMEARGDNDFAAGDIVFYPEVDGKAIIDGSNFHVAAGESDIFGFMTENFAFYDCVLYLKSELSALAQLSVSVFLDNNLKQTVTVQGSKGATVIETCDLGPVYGPNHFVKLYYGSDGLEIEKVVIKFREEIKM